MNILGVLISYSYTNASNNNTQLLKRLGHTNLI